MNQTKVVRCFIALSVHTLSIWSEYRCRQVYPPAETVVPQVKVGAGGVWIPPPLTSPKLPVTIFPPRIARVQVFVLLRAAQTVECLS